MHTQRLTRDEARALVQDFDEVVHHRTGAGEGEWTVVHFKGVQLDVRRVNHRAKADTEFYLRSDDVQAMNELRNQARRSAIFTQYQKLGGKQAVLCEPCTWLSLGYDACRKCGRRGHEPFTIL